MTIWLKFIAAMIVHLLASIGWAQDLIKVPVQIPAITPAVTAFAIARDRGYYRQEGLDVQLIVIPSAVGTQALLGGNVKFSTGGGAGLLPILRGAPMRFVLTTFSRPMFWLYSRPELRSVESLKGRKIGVSSIGSGPDSLLRDLLKKHGLDGTRDVVVLPVGGGALLCVAGGFCRRRNAVDSLEFDGGGGGISPARVVRRARMGRAAGHHQCD